MFKNKHLILQSDSINEFLALELYDPNGSYIYKAGILSKVFFFIDFFQ